MPRLAHPFVKPIGSPFADINALFISDLHLHSLRDTPSKFRQFAAELRKAHPKPDAILIGGDVVMNSVASDLERATNQWSLWHELESELPDVPTIYALGNQDIWGWNRKQSGCTGEERLYGKAMPVEQLGLTETFGVYELGAWKLIVLDSLHEGGRYGFSPSIDSKQIELISKTIDQDPAAPIAILTHVPIIPTSVDFLSMGLTSPTERQEWVLPGNQVCSNGFEVLELLRKGSGRRLVLSGHTHIALRQELLGIEFISAPAVCGGWWRGELANASAGYVSLNLKADGSSQIEFESQSYLEAVPV